MPPRNPSSWDRQRLQRERHIFPSHIWNLFYGGFRWNFPFLVCTFRDLSTTPDGLALGNTKFYLTLYIGTRMRNTDLRDSHPSVGALRQPASTGMGIYLRMPLAMIGVKGIKPTPHNTRPKLCYTLSKKMRRNQGLSQRNGS